jgi:hypothetical protein
VNKTPINITESLIIITNDKLLVPAKQKKKISLNKLNKNTYLSAKWKGTEMSFTNPLGSIKTQENWGLLPPFTGLLFSPTSP